MRYFWAPVPWMLEATIALQIAIGERLEALMIAMLLILNAEGFEKRGCRLGCGWN